jgi:hypothetical protein
MRSKLLGLLIVTAMLVGAVGVYAQNPILPSPNNWWEASLVQNAGTAQANVTFEPIAAAGSVSGGAPVQVQIDPGKNINFMPGQYGNLPNMGDGFNGSAVVSSDQPIVAIGSVANNVIGDIGITGGRAAAQYPGISQAGVAKVFNFPVVKNDYKGKTTTFFIQTVSPGTVNITYIMNEGANTYNASATTTVAGQRVAFHPADVANMPKTCADATCLGAAKVESTVDLAGVYVEYTTGETPANVLLATRGFTAADEDNTVVMPAVKSLWKGRTTGIQIQNVGSAEAHVTFTLARQDGSATAADGKTVAFTIASGASQTYFPGNHEAADTLKGPFGGGALDEFLGAATITSDQPIVAICNENDFAAANVSKQTVYAGFAQKNATSKIMFPLVKELYRDNTTGLQIMNVGSSNVNISAVYALSTKAGFTIATKSDGSPITLAPGTAFTFWGVTNAAWWGADTYVGSTDDFGGVVVDGGTGAMLVGIAQEAVYPGAAGANNMMDTKNSEGFNQ